jgi:hypothetical protein
MQASGKITAEQAEMTRKYMGKLDQNDWDALQKNAENCVERNPALAEKFEAGGIDALSAQDCPPPPQLQNKR